MIKPCVNCKPHDYQDKTLGKNIRIMNPLKESGKCRCTVCGTTHQYEKKEEKATKSNR
jgi:hypothetical protein